MTMSTTNFNITPGGRPNQENPLFTETGPMDSGGGQLLSKERDENIYENPFSISRKLVRSPTLSGGSSPKRMERTNSTGNISYIKTNDQVQENLQLQALKNELQKVSNEKKQQDLLLINLRQQLDELKKELLMVKQNQYSISSNIEPENANAEMQYYTDEEDLAKETEWIRAKTKKKQKNKTEQYTIANKIGGKIKST